MGIEQADGIKPKLYIRDEITKRVKMLIKTELNDANLIKAINMKVVPVATYAMNNCQFTLAELRKLDQIIKKKLREKWMLGNQVMNDLTCTE